MEFYDFAYIGDILFYITLVFDYRYRLENSIPAHGIFQVQLLLDPMNPPAVQDLQLHRCPRHVRLRRVAVTGGQQVAQHAALNGAAL